MTSRQLRGAFVGLAVVLLAFGLVMLLSGGYGIAIGLSSMVVGFVIGAVSLPLFVRAR